MSKTPFNYRKGASPKEEELEILPESAKTLPKQDNEDAPQSPGPSTTEEE